MKTRLLIRLSPLPMDHKESIFSKFQSARWKACHAQFVYTVRHAQQRLVDFTRLPLSYGKQVVAEAEFFGIEVGDSPIRSRRP